MGGAHWNVAVHSSGAWQVPHDLPQPSGPQPLPPHAGAQALGEPGGGWAGSLAGQPANKNTPANNAADGGLIVFTPPLPVALQRGSGVVFGNVAVASHGETVAQVLGSGDGSQAHQRFALMHAPLTHRAGGHASGEGRESGATPEFTLRVGDVQWQRRDTLFGVGPSDRVFTLNHDEHERVWVQFGDGQRGARLPSAANNLRASYRKGLGAAGNVRADTLS